MAPEVVPVLYVLEIQGVKNYFLVEIATAYKLCIYQLLSFKQYLLICNSLFDKIDFAITIIAYFLSCDLLPQNGLDTL